MEIIDIIEQCTNLEGVVKAEQQGNNVLILRKLAIPRQTSDGKLGSYELEYRWLSWGATSIHDVLGSEFSLWQSNELDLNKSLFEQVDLF